MIQARSGDLLEIQFGTERIRFAVLTKKLLFGGNWCFVFHNPMASQSKGASGFNAFVDLIVPKRQSRVERISRNNDFSDLLGPALLKQQPTRGEKDYAIYSWPDRRIESVTHIGTTSCPTREELSAPEYMCIPADFACELAIRQWKPHERIWID